MGFPFWQNWCEKKFLDMPNILIAGCMHASGTGDYLLSNDLIMFSRLDRLYFGWMQWSEWERRSDCCKLVNGTMSFNGNFIANWNSNESGQRFPEFFWFNFMEPLGMREITYFTGCLAVLFPSNRNKHKCIALISYSKSEKFINLSLWV